MNTTGIAPLARVWLIAALAIALVAALALTGCGTTTGTTPTSGASGTGTVVGPIDSVTAQGSGTALSQPDKAEITLGVQAQAASAKAAIKQASDTAKRIVAAVGKQGVDKKDIQTTQVTIEPQYDYSDGRSPRVTGYQATVNVRVTSKELGTVGDIISAATDAGANQVQNLAFTMSDDNPARYEAIDKAVADAKRRAEAMAKAAGRELGDVVTVSEVTAAQPPIVYGDVRMLAEKTAGAAVPIEAGQLETQASVTVVYRLK